MKLHKLGLLAATLGTIYILSTPNIKEPAQQKQYNVPATIEVIDATYTSRDGTLVKKSSPSKLENIIISTDSINFDEDFIFKTSDYTLDKHSDFWLSRQIGGFFSLINKAVFWDWDAGQGLDGERSKAVLAMLENRDDIKDLTVRLNHNEVWTDLGRLFTDEKVKDRNNFLARASIGLLSTFGGELLSELRRGDYYNPMTQTVVAYSNIESFAAHEMGHHKDYQRFNSDWMYSLSSLFPPATLYKEAKASIYAHDMLSETDKHQTARYLIPAYITYILGMYAGTKKLIKRLDPDVEKISDISTSRAMKTYVNHVGSLAAGIGAYELAEYATSFESLGVVAFAAGMYVSLKLGSRLLDTDYDDDSAIPL